MVVAPAEGATVQNPERGGASAHAARPSARRRRWLLRALPAAALAAALIGLFAPGASAIIAHLRNGRALSYTPSRRAVRPFDAFFSNLDYNGGPVMPANTNYTIYWDPSGAPEGYPAGYEAGVNRYLEDLAHDSGGTANVDSVSAQYNDAAGQFANYESHYGGTFVDKQPYPTSGNCKVSATCLTDAQIQAELTRFVKAEGLPTDLEHEYFLLTPPKVESCFEEESETECSAGIPTGEYCAYHGNVPLPEGHELIYSNDPYVTGIGGCDDGNHPNGPSDGALEGGLSHEHNESITDPVPNSAWTDFGGVIGEIGDKCGGTTGEPVGTVEGKSYNQVINGHFYWYQEEWSNQGSACRQSLSFTGERPTAIFTAHPGAGNEVRFNAACSTAPGEVLRYNWQFNAPAGSTPYESASATAAHTFPAPGSYTVALTVLSPNGTSTGTEIPIVVGAGAKPTAAFCLASGPASAGSPLAFDGSSSAGPHEITSYSWNFGDGSPLQGGAAPTHAYAAAGSYEVTLTVTDSASLTASYSHVISVAAGSGGGAIPTPVPIVTTPTAAPAGGGSQPPASPSALTATVALAASTAQVQGNGRSAVRLTCTGTASTCRGRLALTVRVLSRGHRPRTVRIATASFSIPVGRTSTVRLLLSTLGRSLLRSAHGRMSADIALSKSSPAPAQAQSHAVQLVLQRARKHWVARPTAGLSG
jgi:PKD repeat protein